MRSIMLPLGSNGVKARELGCSHIVRSRHEFKHKTGRWDRNRTGTLRFWSLLPFVQQRSGKYTKSLEIAHFDGPKYVDVHQRSPALGSKLGSTCGNQAAASASRECSRHIETIVALGVELDLR